MNLLIEYFDSDSVVRKSEYLQSLYQNISNSLIEKIFIFISDGSQLSISSSKVEIVRIDERPTFRKLFEYCNQNLKNQICIVSNGDIVFDDSLIHVNDIEMNNVFLALTRWESHLGGRVPFNNGVSQDSWIFKSPVSVNSEMEFTMGKPGSDNRIAYLMKEAGYVLKNPGNQIIGLHKHSSRHRTYTKAETIKGPYVGLIPNEDISMETQVFDIDGFDEQGRPYKF